MKVQFLPVKKTPEPDHPSKGSKTAKPRHRLSREEEEAIKEDFRCRYDKGTPIKQIGLLLHLSDKQVSRIFTKLVTDRDNPLKLHEANYELIELTPAFKRYFRRDYFPQGCMYVEAKLDNDQVILKPVYF